MRHRVSFAARVGWLLVGCGVLTAACSSTSFPRDAVSSLRRAASRSASARGATLTGTLDGNSGPVVRVTGSADFRDRTASLTTSSAVPSRVYPPFDSRFVGGWQYIEVDSAVKRPSRLRPDVNWIGFRGRPRGIPLPDRTMPPTYPFQLLDQLESGVIAGARFVGAKAHGEIRVEFQLPDLSVPQVQVTYTLTIGTDGRIADVATTDRFRDGGTTRDQPGSDLEFAWTADVAQVSAPPADQVQRLSPGENLYAGSGSTTSSTLPTLGPVLPSDAAAGNLALFNSDRAQLEVALRAQPDPKLIGLAFDTHSNTVNISFVYGASSPTTKTRDDAFAWQVGQTVSSSFWFPELVQGVVGLHGNATWLPKLRVKLDDITYACPSRVEIAMAAGGVSLNDWVAECPRSA